MRVEVDGKRRQIPVRAMSLHDQEPVEWAIRRLRLDRASKAQPRERKRLRTPIGAVDDGVARIDRTHRFPMDGGINDREARKSGKCAIIVMKTDKKILSMQVRFKW